MISESCAASPAPKTLSGYQGKTGNEFSACCRSYAFAYAMCTVVSAKLASTLLKY
jgi:hypothetical protein